MRRLCAGAGAESAGPFLQPWASLAVLVARNSYHRAGRRGANRLDDSFDQHGACRGGCPRFQAARASSTRRGALDGPGHGVFDTGAFVLSNLGMKMEQVAVISVLGSLYGAVTVGLAAFFLKEHVSRWQWAGIITIFVGIFLISR